MSCFVGDVKLAKLSTFFSKHQDNLFCLPFAFLLTRWLISRNQNTQNGGIPTIPLLLAICFSFDFKIKRNYYG